MVLQPRASRFRRPPYSPLADNLPDPRADMGAFLYEAETRMLRAGNKFAALEFRLRYLEDAHIEEAGGDELTASINMDKDAELRMRAAMRNNARERARMYSDLILAEEALTRMVPSRRLPRAEPTRTSDAWTEF